MTRKLIIDGNCVYELDETCMLIKRSEQKKHVKPKKEQHAKENEKK